MLHSERRKPYEFDFATKREALLSTHICEICGKPELPNDRFECNHAVAIWFALENPCLTVEVIKSLANLQIVHHSCHRKLHENESRQYYKEKVPEVVARYLDSVVNPRLDDWRDKLRKYPVGHD